MKRRQVEGEGEGVFSRSRLGENLYHLFPFLSQVGGHGDDSQGEEQVDAWLVHLPPQAPPEAQQVQLRRCLSLPQPQKRTDVCVPVPFLSPCLYAYRLSSLAGSLLVVALLLLGAAAAADGVDVERTGRRRRDDLLLPPPPPLIALLWLWKH
mmetsp:Transcript_14383/g.28946  ORF Transcript_14383/g.28946 Transcript_14383/m.28946 type:complete len:152 (-) Transcript_14383:678-1133(-)